MAHRNNSQEKKKKGGKGKIKTIKNYVRIKTKCFIYIIFP